MRDRRLSSRELHVFALLGQGYTSAMVAEELGITESTVKNHVASVFKKLDVCNRYGAFFELGWLKPPIVESVLDSGTMSDN